MIINNKVTKNALWIIGCKIVQSVLALIINMITARYLGPSNYGLISYAASIVVFFTPIMQLGIPNVLVNEFIKNPEEEGEIIGSSFVLTLVSSLFCILGIVSFTAIVNVGETQTIIVCFLYSFILLFQSIETIQYWFQSKYLSKYVSISMLCAYLVVSLYKIYLLVNQKNIFWFAVTNAFDICLIDIILLILYKKLKGQKLHFSKRIAKRLFSAGRYYIVSSLMVTIFSQTDKIMIKLMEGNKNVGFYSAAVTIAGLTGFIYQAIIDSMRPLILENKASNNQGLFKANLAKLYCIVIYLALAQSFVMTFFSKYIVLILYGSAYAQATSALRIVVWYTTFAYIGSIRNVWILAEGKQKFLWIINFSGATANIILNLILIPPLGINGAAIASLFTQIFTNVIIGYIIRPITDNNRILIKGLNIKILFNYLKKLKK